MNQLMEELKQQKEGFLQKAPQEVIDKMNQATAELLESGVATGLKEGEKVPDFVLQDALGNDVQLYEELK